MSNARFTVDFAALKKLVAFDFIELFEVDSVESPNTFTEHPLSAYNVPKTDSRFEIVSSRVMMGLGLTTERPVVFTPKHELFAELGI